MEIEEEHFRKLERMYHGAPINRFYEPTMRVGNGTAELRSMTAGLSGASELTLSGRVGTVSATASGASRLALEQQQVDALEVGLSGASNAEVWGRRTLSATLSGASSLRYRGSPTLTRQEISGGSSITRVS